MSKTVQKSVTSEDQVRTLAYSLWEQAGRPEGDGQDFWLQAESTLLTVTKKPSRSRTTTRTKK